MPHVKKARSLELFFVDGAPDGMLMASIPFQWSGHVLVSSRTQLRDALRRHEVSRPGVYLLIGENEDEEPRLYIGESDDIRQRIKDHDAKQDWWTTVVFITSNGEPLNKAHVKYLESRLIEKAKQVAKITLTNNVSPSLNQLSEVARTHMEDFLENIFLVLPALRFDFFLENTRTKASVQEAEQQQSPIFVLSTLKHDITATATLMGYDFVVQEGSIAQGKWVGAQNTGYSKLHQELIKQGVLVLQQNGKCIFAKNYAFNSPSAAAAVVNGRSSNGTVEWKIKDTNRTYKEWEAQEIKA